MKKLLLGFIVIPSFLYSQSAIIKNLCPVIKHHHSNDSIKSIYYPLVNSTPLSSSEKINSYIKSVVFRVRDMDTAQSAQALLTALYSKYKGLGLYYHTNFNKNGFLSLTIHITTYCEDNTAPIYLNFDLGTGKLITLKDLLNTKNDSVSLRQAIVPQITDSIRNFEQTINRNNPKYSDIIEQLNSGLGTFIHTYQSDFILTDKELVVYYDCILPSGLISYNHTYQAIFKYKVLRNIFKTDVAFRLQ